MACKTELKPARKREIAKQAHDLLEINNYDFFSGESISILPIAYNLGFRVGYLSDMEDKEQGLLSINGMSKIIGLNKKYPNNTQRFVIAHEIGHFILHYDSSKEPVYLHRENEKDKPIQEQEADWFAANLLMPDESFKNPFQHRVAGKLRFTR